MMDLPAVFVHEGKQRYVYKAICLAKKYNPNVYLIGDLKNQSFCENWVLNEELGLERFDCFKSIYRHMSPNSYQFELNCFKRFYLLQNFMSQQNQKACMMLDSDLCTYVNYSELGLEDYDAAFSMEKEQEPYIWAASPHCSYWTWEALEDFICFFEETYEKNIGILQEKWNWHQKQGVPGGICDMTLLYLWSRQNRWNWLNLAQEYRGKVFDVNICVEKDYSVEAFCMNPEFKIKKVCFIENRPYFTIEKDQRKICANTIHASGENKKYISVFAKCSNSLWSYRIADAWSSVKQILHRILKR